jgi:signal transduction histidine kinase
MTIAKKIYVTLLIGLFLGLLVKESIMNKQLEETQYKRAQSEAKELKNSIMVFREYTAELSKNGDNLEDKNKVHPLNTVIESMFVKYSHNSIKIKTVSDNPMLAENIANKLELQDIKYFNENKYEHEKFGLHKENETEYYHYAYALRLDKRCLKCHSDYNIGETRGIISIYIPKKDFDNDRILLSNNSYVVTFIVLMILFTALYFIVIKPLSFNMEKFKNNLEQFFAHINGEDDEMNFQPINSSDELGKMSKQIEKNIEKTKAIVETHKNNEKRLQALVKERNENIKSKRVLRSNKSKSIKLLVENISTNIHAPLNELKESLSTLNTDDSRIDDALQEIDNIDHALKQYKFFFEHEDKKTTFKVKDVIKNCNTINHFEYKKNNINIVDDYEDIEIDTYKNELSQVMINILSTSKDNLKNSENSENIILISTMEKDKKVIISIKDNGGGFDKNSTVNLANPVISPKSDCDTHSLELYIANEIIRNHLNGKLEISNISIDYNGSTFQGSEFIITLPKEM